MHYFDDWFHWVVAGVFILTVVSMVRSWIRERRESRTEKP